MPISNDQLFQMQARLGGERIKSGRSNAVNTGKSFEVQIQKTLNEYHRQGIMWGTKVDPPVKVVGSGKFRKVIFLTNHLLDFTGILRGGRAVHFEAKSTAAARLPLMRPGGLTVNQVTTIRTLDVMGAIVFVLWRITTPPVRTFFLSSYEILMHVEANKISIKPQNCRELPVTVGVVSVPFADFL